MNFNNTGKFQIEIMPREECVKISHSTPTKYWTEVVSIQTPSGPFYLEVHSQVVGPDLSVLVPELDWIFSCGLYPGAQCLLWTSSHWYLEKSMHLKWIPRYSVIHGICAFL